MVVRFMAGAVAGVVFLSFCAAIEEAKKRAEVTRQARSEKHFALVGVFTKAIVRENERLV